MFKVNNKDTRATQIALTLNMSLPAGLKRIGPDIDLYVTLERRHNASDTSEILKVLLLLFTFGFLFFK